MAEASWLADPSGAHELRYWNGAAGPSTSRTRGRRARTR